MEKLKLSELSDAQRQQLMSELKAQEKAEKERVKGEREAYKALVSDAVNGMFPEIERTSAALAAQKKAIYEAFQEALRMKSALYGVAVDRQRSHTFINAEGTLRITLGTHENEAYDDTVEMGIAKVKAYIGSLARDGDSRMLVDAVLRLLARDQQGNLKASRVVQLQKMAEQSGDEEFADGVRIIREAYRPQISKTYVRAERKSGEGAWVNVPLGMTEASY
jgi:hypothetical protein